MRLRKTVRALLKANGYRCKDVSLLASGKSGFLVFGALLVIVIAVANASLGVSKVDIPTVSRSAVDESLIVERVIGLKSPSTRLNMVARDLQIVVDLSEKLNGDGPDVFAWSSMSDCARKPTVAAKYTGQRTGRLHADAGTVKIAYPDRIRYRGQHEKRRPLPATLTAAAMAKPSPTARLATLTTTDSLLTLGAARTVIQKSASQEGGAVKIVATANPSNTLWQLIASPWAVKSGSVGNVTMTYSGTGAVVTTVNYPILEPNNSGVNGYPFILYGGDQWGNHIGGQPPVFPARLGSMNALNIDVTYALSGVMGGDTDVLFDEWLIPTRTYMSGSGGALEVEILPFFKFAFGKTCQAIKIFTEHVVVNGSPTSMSFSENYCGPGTGGDVLFYPINPTNGVASGEIQFNMLDFLNEAAGTAGLSGWWVAGIEFGTEFGDASSLNYGLTTTKLRVSQDTQDESRAAAQDDEVQSPNCHVRDHRGQRPRLALRILSDSQCSIGESPFRTLAGIGCGGSCGRRR